MTPPNSLTLYAILLIKLLLLTGCSTATTGPVLSEIPGQLNDGGWVMNIPGQGHTHRVVLSECPDKPVVTHHVHDHDQAGMGPHKHNGCFFCPLPNSLVKRITS